MAAGFTNVLYVPGKAIFCGSTGILWVVFMLVTLGVAYSEAATFVKAGCGGKWMVTGEDMQSSPQRTGVTSEAVPAPVRRTPHDVASVAQDRGARQRPGTARAGGA